MGRIIAWTMIIMGSVILGFNGYRYWGEINIAVKDPKVAMEIGEDWQNTKHEPSLTSVENLNASDHFEEESGFDELTYEEEGTDDTDENTEGDIETTEEGTNDNTSNNTKNNNNTSVNNQGEKKVASKDSPKKKYSTSPKKIRKRVKRSSLKVGSTIGQLIIPKIGAYLPIVEGTDDKSLKKGVGRYRGWGTVAPDQTGHVVLSGHRDTVFRKLGQLRIGDKMYVKYNNRIYTYQIRRTWITHAEDRTVIVPIPRPVLTVTTCYPFIYKGNAPDRYIIRADLIRINNV